VTSRDIFAQLNQPYLLTSMDASSLFYANPAALQLLDIGSEQLQTRLTQLSAAIVQSVGGEPVRCRFNSLSLRVHSSKLDGQQLAVMLEPYQFAGMQERQLYTLLDNLGAYVYCKDKQYRYSYCNQQVCDLFGLQLEQILGITDQQLFDEATGRKMVERIDSRVVEQGVEIETHERNYLSHLKEFRDYLTVKKPLLGEQGDIEGLFGISMDITELKQTQKRLHISEQRLTSILDNVGAYIYIKDREHRFEYVNRQTELLFGLANEQILGRNNVELLGAEQGEEFDRTDRQVFETLDKVSCVETFAAEGQSFYYWTVKIPLRNQADEVDSYIGISLDITEQKRLEQQVREYNQALQQKIHEVTLLKDDLEYHASHDSLTGLMNRRAFHGVIDNLMLGDHQQQLVLMMLDLDHFKAVNDSFGHQRGDEVICLVANLMKQNCRRSDVICRYGGEEFLLLLSGVDLQQALEKANQLRLGYRQRAAEVFADMPLQSLSIGLSIGCSSGGFEAFYSAADRALYRAKQQGRNRCEWLQLD